jgi:hypothetical protein
MRPTQTLACVLTALALLASCDRPSGPTTTTEASSATTVALTTPGHPAPSPEEAIALSRLAAHWPLSPDQVEGQRVEHRLLGRHELSQSVGEQRRLLVYSSRPGGHDCNACSPDLSFFEFQLDPADQSPRLVMASLAAVSLGYAGEAPQARVQALGGDRYAVLLSWEAFAQGSSSQLLMLTPIEGRMREVLFEEIGASHEQVIDRNTTVNVEWTTDYRFLPGPGPYLDLHLKRHFIKGKRWLLDPVRGPFASELTAQGQVPTELVYRFDGQRMQLVMSR